MVLCLAYRPFQHENTGYTPNMLMLWKEVATLMYGKSAKLTSYWYVPYKIVQQHTVTFKIRKGLKGLRSSEIKIELQKSRIGC